MSTATRPCGHWECQLASSSGQALATPMRLVNRMPESCLRVVLWFPVFALTTLGIVVAACTLAPALVVVRYTRYRIEGKGC